MEQVLKSIWILRFVSLRMTVSGFDMKKLKRVVTILIFAALLVLFLRWLLTSSDILGEETPIQGREHLKANEAPPVYNSNPPTSGAHDEVPAKPGIYEYSLEDRHLVHSLEHGYVVISYNCGIKSESKIMNQKSGEVLAHEETPGMKTASDSAQQSTVSASKANTSDSNCTQLKDSLKKIFDKYKGWKIIVEPRENLEVRLAITAWGRLYKPSLSFVNGLGQDDVKKVEKFIDAFRDKGPEQTPD